MEKIIRTLKETREKYEKSFVENSIICYGATSDRPVPDVKEDLEMIIQLNQAISILENALITKRSDLNVC